MNFMLKCAVAFAVLLAAPFAIAATGAPNDPWIIGMSQCNLNEPWRVQMNADIRRAAEAHDNIRVIFRDAQNDTLRQRAQIEEFIAQRVDVLLVSPLEAAPLTAPVAAAHGAGIPVIVLDRAVMGEAFTVFIGADNTRIGRAAGLWAKRALGGEGRVVELMGLMTSTPGQDRHRGFLEGISGSQLDVIFRADMRWLEPNARREMESALARFDAIDLVYGHNDPAAHGAWLAARAAGREKDILFVGIDGLPHEGLRYVRDGVLDVCFEYPTGGAEAIDAALRILNGEELPKRMTLNSRYFTPENVDAGGDWLDSLEDDAADSEE